MAPRRIPWLRYCVNCGHLPLNNWISQLVTRLGCGYADTPQFKAWVAGGRKAQP